VQEPEERRRGLEALERVERLEAEILKERGGQPFSPPSWELLNESRDERTRGLDGLSGLGEGITA